MTRDAIKRSLLPEPMKHRSFCRGILGASLAIFLPVLARTSSAAETAPGDAPAAALTTDSPIASGDASAQTPALADTDAPAKLVSTEKPLPPSIRPSGPVAEVVKLANSGLDESVMLAFVTNSTSTFNLGAEEIIYLNDIGVPGSVVTSMIQRDQALKTSLASAANPPPPAMESPPAPAVRDTQLSAASSGPDQVPPQPGDPGAGYPVEAPLTPPNDGSDAMFYDSLSPYGNWVDVAGYGPCWQPTVELVNPGWQPYFDCGRWVYSDCGWYWLSDYSWGWAPFHFGSWFRHGRLGWCWVPGRVWGPSWVCWRYDNDFCGWAPLPPGAGFTAGVGLTFHGHHVWDRDDLGLRADHYHFVAWNHFNDRQLRPFSLPPQEVARVYATSTVGTRISGDGHTVINNGLPPSQVAAATHRMVHPVALREVNEPVSIGTRADRFEESGHALAVYRPNPDLAARLPARELGTGSVGAIRSASGRVMPQSVSPAAPRSGTSRRSSNDAKQESWPFANQSAPLILRGPQPSALKESAPANSLVVIGGGRPTQPATLAQPWSAVSFASRPAVDSGESTASTKPSGPTAVTPAQNAVSRQIPNQYQQRNWMGTVSSSPRPSWFAGNEANSGRPLDSVLTPRPATSSYQPVPRSEVPRYSPTPSYAPQRSYAAPAWSAPARSPSFEPRPAPSAPAAPSAAPAPSVSHSPSPQPQSSGRNGR
jgi:hypothetical protein